MLKDLHAITAIEEHDDVLFKRDDLLQPYDDSPVNGGKLRQCHFLLENAYDKIVKEHGSTVATASSVHSPQGAIVTRVARSFGLKTIVAIGGNDRSLEHSTVKWCKHYGADVRVLSKLGYTSVLNARLSLLRENPFIVHFGMNAQRDFNAIVRSTAAQCENIPRDVDNIVFAVGSGVTMAGALVGLQLFDIKPKRTIGVQIAAVDRTRRISELSNAFDWEYELHLDKTFPYSREIYHCTADFAVALDPIYEAKAFLFMRKNLDLKGRTLFWIVGNSAPLHVDPPL